MFTSFSSIKNKPAVKQEDNGGEGHSERLALLTKAIETVLEDNSYRVYIEEYPYLVEFKLPTHFNLVALKTTIEQKLIKSSSHKVFGGDILVHTFVITGKSEPIEVFYKPFSTPRL